MKGVRGSAKAIIIENGKMLFTKNMDHLGIFYLLPGGGQEHGELMTDALKREGCYLSRQKSKSYSIFRRCKLVNKRSQLC